MRMHKKQPKARYGNHEAWNSKKPARGQESGLRLRLPSPKEVTNPIIHILEECGTVDLNRTCNQKAKELKLEKWFPPNTRTVSAADVPYTETWCPLHMLKMERNKEQLTNLFPIKNTKIILTRMVKSTKNEEKGKRDSRQILPYYYHPSTAIYTSQPSERKKETLNSNGCTKQPTKIPTNKLSTGTESIYIATKS